MTDIHRIRLRAPWECERVGEERPEVFKRVSLPCDLKMLLGNDFRGTARLRRRFNCPTGLEEHEIVRVVLEGVTPWGEVALNGTIVGEAQAGEVPSRFDITPLLEERNELVVEIDVSGEQPSGIRGCVWLEIED